MLDPGLESRLSACDAAELGPHAAALLAELKRAVRAGMPLSAVLLAATLVDVVAHEEAGPAGLVDGIDFAYAGNKAALGWLRGRRNELLHHEGPTDGLMGESVAADWHWRDAGKAVTALLDYLEDLNGY
ncbi:MAG: hypothetical protein VXY13_10430 [Pseudomonadota bacterium]|nr:hypothetical protein [Pseudomonadota bacterium]MEC8674151.1 hypothetical protein [Pseudomonadota bacterium]